MKAIPWRVLTALLLLLPALSDASETLRSRILAVLPAPVRSILPGKTTRSELIRSMGKPLPKSTQNVAYFAMDHGESTDLAVGFEGDKVRYYSFEMSESEQARLPSSSLKAWIPESSLAQAKKERSAQAGQSEGGRDFWIKVTTQALSLRFTESESAPLRSVLVWKEGVKAP